ncbi:hypothetical protein KM043_008484 [Ampulex compressa]|nr:hypothetical protein KM043_008484 [Ampulex compressa]
MYSDYNAQPIRRDLHPNPSCNVKHIEVEDQGPRLRHRLRDTFCPFENSQHAIWVWRGYESEERLPMKRNRLVAALFVFTVLGHHLTNVEPHIKTDERAG